jgi:DnaJ-class molecular chaperone
MDPRTQMSTYEGSQMMNSGKSTAASKDTSDNQAFHELMEILKEPFMANCDKCEGTGLRQARTCQVCDGKGFIRIDFI